MKKRFSNYAFLFLPFLLASCSSGNTERRIFANGGEESISEPTIVTGLENASNVELLNDHAAEFVNQFPQNGANSVRNYVQIGEEPFKPVTVDISWTAEEGYKYFLFKIADNDKLIASKQYFLSNPSIQLKHLFIDTTYYYQIDAIYSSYTTRSRLFNFVTNPTVRTLDVETVNNFRDLGGVKTSDGKYRVKQGLLYRSANFDAISDEDKTYVLNELGMHSDVDLRAAAENKKVDPLGVGEKYFQFGEKGSPYYTGGGTTHIDGNSTEYRSNLANYLKVFSIEENYPAVFHCAIGRDRTGTIATLLYSILGVSLERIQLDYAFSFLSSAAVSAETDIEKMNGYLLNMYNYINCRDTSKSEYENAKAFYLDLGISDAEINSIRNILLERI